MPNVSDTTDVLIDWCEARGTATGIEEFLQVMSEQNFQYLLPHILQELDYREEKRKQNQQLYVTTARHVSDMQLTDLQSAFKVSEGVAATETTTPSLLGGVSCKRNGLQVSDTFRGRLQKLQARLQS